MLLYKKCVHPLADNNKIADFVFSWQTVDVGEKVHLEAKVKGKDAACTWYKQKMEIKPDKNFAIKFEHGMARYHEYEYYHLYQIEKW